MSIIEEIRSSIPSSIKIGGDNSKIMVQTDFKSIGPRDWLGIIKTLLVFGIILFIVLIIITYFIVGNTASNSSRINPLYFDFSRKLFYTWNFFIGNLSTTFSSSNGFRELNFEVKESVDIATFALGIIFVIFIFRTLSRTPEHYSLKCEFDVNKCKLYISAHSNIYKNLNFSYELDENFKFILRDDSSVYRKHSDGKLTLQIAPCLVLYGGFGGSVERFRLPHIEYTKRISPSLAEDSKKLAASYSKDFQKMTTLSLVLNRLIGYVLNTNGVAQKPPTGIINLDLPVERNPFD